ncbi:hypothetical protein CIC12_08405 [Burkholderia sp. SG-MS1]|uniref:hypothetical protein n=1 Tax=Paraburkholderia sp. SG-MS1 TaxID=2023741 RepID=UPI0014487FF5|nr:hypothetical protein [Paraburkholderia sp. SG-MS1]NKJ46762.1 hypothetical protein [Paraburkholderia sp. SG-MS1]
MAAIDRIVVEIVDHDRRARGAQFEAQRGVQIELAAGGEPEVHFVSNRAGGPRLFRDPRHRRKPIPVRFQIRRRMDGTASMRSTASMSCASPASRPVSNGKLFIHRPALPESLAQVA